MSATDGPLRWMSSFIHPVAVPVPDDPLVHSTKELPQSSTLTSSGTTDSMIHISQSQSHSHVSQSPCKTRTTTATRSFSQLKQSEDGEESVKLKAENGALRTQYQHLHAAFDRARKAIDERHVLIKRQQMMLRAVHAALECTICVSTLELPFTLNCGHSFCLHCLQSWFSTIRELQPATPLLQTNTCPLCRTIVTKPTPAYLLRSLIDTLHPPSEDMVKFRQHTERHLVWKGIFEQDLEQCNGCGGIAKEGLCLGFAGVHGRDVIVGYTSGNGEREGPNGEEEVVAIVERVVGAPPVRRRSETSWHADSSF